MSYDLTLSYYQRKSHELKELLFWADEAKAGGLLPSVVNTHRAAAITPCNQMSFTGCHRSSAIHRI